MSKKKRKKVARQIYKLHYVIDANRVVQNKSVPYDDYSKYHIVRNAILAVEQLKGQIQEQEELIAKMKDKENSLMQDISLLNNAGYRVDKNRWGKVVRVKGDEVTVIEGNNEINTVPTGTDDSD